MTFPLVGVGLSIVLSLLRGGRFRHATDQELRWLPVLIAGLLLQTLLDALAVRGLVADTGTTVLLLLSEAAVLAFCVTNWYRPGMVLVALGFTANALVIMANNGMPVSAAAIQALGGDPAVAAEILVGKHHLMTDTTTLKFLADVIPIPPLNLAISIGDVVLVAGMVPLAYDMMTPPGDAARLGRRQDRRTSARMLNPMPTRHHSPTTTRSRIDAS